MAPVSNVGLEAAQGSSALAQTRKTTIDAGIAMRTLDYLNRENLTMEQIQYTAHNVFSSKMLETFEKTLSGRAGELSMPYKEIGLRIQGMINDAGIGNVGGGMASYNRITGQLLSEIITKVADWASKNSVDAFSSLGNEIMKGIIGD